MPTTNFKGDDYYMESPNGRQRIVRLIVDGEERFHLYQRKFHNGKFYLVEGADERAEKVWRANH